MAGNLQIHKRLRSMVAELVYLHGRLFLFVLGLRHRKTTAEHDMQVNLHLSSCCSLMLSQEHEKSAVLVGMEVEDETLD